MHEDSIQWKLEVDKKDIAYLVGLFESYSDFAVVRTLDQDRGHVELLISPDYLDDVSYLIENLADEMPIRILSKGS